MIDECETLGFEFITGGFLDRIGENGIFPFVDETTNIWEAFPYSGFFRYPLSGACPNKVCVMLGKVKISNGQHYAVFNDKNVWGEEELIINLDIHQVEVRDLYKFITLNGIQQF